MYPRIALGAEEVGDLVFRKVGRHGGGKGHRHRRIALGGGALAQAGSNAGGVIALDRPGTAAAVQRPGPREQQLQVIIDLGHRAHGRARGPDRIGLVDRDRRRHALDPVDLGAVHPVEELAGVGREGLDVAALTFGIKGIEDQRRLAAARDPGYHDQLAGRDVEVEILQIVLASPANPDRWLERGGRACSHSAMVVPCAQILYENTVSTLWRKQRILRVFGS